MLIKTLKWQVYKKLLDQDPKTSSYLKSASGSDDLNLFRSKVAPIRPVWLLLLFSSGCSSWEPPLWRHSLALIGLKLHRLVLLFYELFPPLSALVISPKRDAIYLMSSPLAAHFLYMWPPDTLHFQQERNEHSLVGDWSLKRRRSFFISYNFFLIFISLTSLFVLVFSKALFSVGQNRWQSAEFHHSNEVYKNSLNVEFWAHFKCVYQFSS